jgi:phosphoribosylformimino-5-aminoimidazole carboxamide ribonucleotide (ProFAR) isomerase
MAWTLKSTLWCYRIDVVRLTAKVFKSSAIITGSIHGFNLDAHNLASPTMSTVTQPQESTRVALVTGAAQGIGRAIALRLAADGLDVAVNDLSDKIDALTTLVEEIQHHGRRAVVITTDVSKEDEVKGMVELAVSTLGRLDVVN